MHSTQMSVPELCTCMSSLWIAIVTVEPASQNASVCCEAKNYLTIKHDTPFHKEIRDVCNWPTLQVFSV